MPIRFAPKHPETPPARPTPSAEADIPVLARKRKPGGGRKPSSDPKDLISLRVPRSVIARYQASGDDWRARMVEAIEKAA